MPPGDGSQRPSPAPTELEVDLALVGLSHRTAPVDVREAVSVGASEHDPRLRAIAEVEGVSEVFLLSTCNRTEVLVAGQLGPASLARVRALCFGSASAEQLYEHRDLRALMHVLSVASGLDSLVLGESEILAQTREAARRAAEAETLGNWLRPFFDSVFSAAKRVRRDTHVGQGTLSVARAGVELSKGVFGSLDRARALIVGAGETGQLVAKHLRAEGLRDLVFLNRTVERAAQAAAEHDALSAGLDQLPRRLGDADLVFACVEGGVVIEEAHLCHLRLARRDRPFLAVDLSVPRAIDPKLARLENLFLYDLDDLSGVIQQNREMREAALMESTGILVGEVHKFLSLRRQAEAAPLFRELGERFGSLRDEVLDEICGEHSDEAQMRLAHELTKRLSDAAFRTLKQSLRSPTSSAALEAEFQRYRESLETGDATGDRTP
ncbi:MAG: glutamyl-tRNA reductase [Planctomycetota bacterium]